MWPQGNKTTLISGGKSFPVASGAQDGGFPSSGPMGPWVTGDPNGPGGGPAAAQFGRTSMPSGVGASQWPAFTPGGPGGFASRPPGMPGALPGSMPPPPAGFNNAGMSGPSPGMWNNSPGVDYGNPGLAGGSISMAPPGKIPPSASAGLTDLGGLRGEKSAPSIGVAGGNYDLVHLSSRNARLEEKLAKALAKNRSMAKYYDQLLAKTREQHEAEKEDIVNENRRLHADLDSLAGVQEVLSRERAEREQLTNEIASMRQTVQAQDTQRAEESGGMANTIRHLTDTLAAKDAELSEIRKHVGGEAEVQEMKTMLETARRERDTARSKDHEMAKQLSDIKDQALNRIKENVEAQQELSSVKERLYKAEIDRDDALRKVQEMRDNFNPMEEEMRMLRRRLDEVTTLKETLEPKAINYQVVEGKLANAEREREIAARERTAAQGKVEELQDKLMLMTSEKEMLVRQGVHSVHLEAQLSDARAEIARLRSNVERDSLEGRLEKSQLHRETSSLSRDLRGYIFNHARWERTFADNLHDAGEAHAVSQRSVVRLVATAEREAGALAAMAIEVIRSARGLVREIGSECMALVHANQAAAHAAAQEVVNRLKHDRTYAIMERNDAIERSEAAELAARRARASAQAAGAHLMNLLRTHHPEVLVDNPEAAHAAAGLAADIRGMATSVGGAGGFTAGATRPMTAASEGEDSVEDASDAGSGEEEAPVKEAAASNTRPSSRGTPGPSRPATAGEAAGGKEAGGLPPELPLGELQLGGSLIQEGADPLSVAIHVANLAMEQGAGSGEPAGSGAGVGVGTGVASLRKELAEIRFQKLGLFMWKRSRDLEQSDSVLLLQQQSTIAKRERVQAVAMLNQANASAKGKRAVLSWAVLAAAVLRWEDSERREDEHAVVYALTQKTLQLQLAIKERRAAQRLLAAKDAELAHVKSMLSGAQLEHKALVDHVTDGPRGGEGGFKSPYRGGGTGQGAGPGLPGPGGSYSQLMGPLGASGAAEQVAMWLADWNEELRALASEAEAAASVVQQPKVNIDQLDSVSDGEGIEGGRLSRVASMAESRQESQAGGEGDVTVGADGVEIMRNSSPSPIPIGDVEGQLKSRLDEILANMADLEAQQEEAGAHGDQMTSAERELLNVKAFCIETLLRLVELQRRAAELEGARELQTMIRANTVMKKLRRKKSKGPDRDGEEGGGSGPSLKKTMSRSRSKAMKDGARDSSPPLKRSASKRAVSGGGMRRSASFAKGTIGGAGSPGMDDVDGAADDEELEAATMALHEAGEMSAPSDGEDLPPGVPMVEGMGPWGPGADSGVSDSEGKAAGKKAGKKKAAGSKSKKKK